MLNKEQQLMQMELKETKILIFIFATLISCNSFKQQHNSIYGKWIDTKNRNITVNIDSLTQNLTIDYSAIGGNIFSGQYSLSQGNKIESDIIPKGAEIQFDKKGNIKLYPIKKIYTKDIESIYSLTFTKR